MTNWLIANKLTLNVDKSNFLYFHTAKKKKPSFKLKMKNEPLIEKEYTKYLGVLIDNKLTWKFQIKQVNVRLAKGIGSLSKLRHYVPKTTLKNISNF